MYIDAARFRLGRVRRRHAVAHKPVKMIAHARLPRFVAEIPFDDAVLDHAADAGHRPFAVAEQYVAGGGAHDHQHFSRLGHAHRRKRHVRVHVADGHRDALRQPQPPRRLRRQIPGAPADGQDRPFELFGRKMPELGIERGEKVVRRIPVPLVPQALVAGRAGVARPDIRHLQHDPVGRFHKRRHRVVHVRRLADELHDFGHRPLGGYLSAVAREKFLAAGAGYAVQFVGLRLRRMVFPQFHVRVRIGGVPGQKTQRRTVAGHRQHGAGGKIHADTHDVGRVDAALLNGRRNDRIQHVQVVLRMLQGPVLTQRRAVGKRLVHHAVRIVHHALPRQPPVGQVGHHRPPGQRAEVYAYRIFFSHKTSPCFAQRISFLPPSRSRYSRNCTSPDNDGSA